ncbi:MAG: restriction endonuclease subunit S [Candidatus Coatesbacteria bacterium]|nr:restriction endonuclease subunit S [Candidatus Coatesbacteria bacterium]
MEDKIFITRSGEIEGAFNPLRYKKKINFPKSAKIRDFGLVISETFIPAKLYPDQIFDWLRIDNVEIGGFLNENSIITVLGKEISKSTVQLALEGDILIARLGPSLANEKILIAPKTKNTLVVSGEFIVFRSSGLQPEVIVNILKTKKYLNYVLSKGRGATPSRFRIDRNDFSELSFPLMEKGCFDKIYILVREINNRYMSFIQQADSLLASIDEYVLSMLGIEMPELEDKKVFTVSSIECKGKRIDPHYHSPKFEVIENSLKTGLYKPVILDIFITKIHYGISIENEYVKKGIPLLRILNLKPNEIDISDVVYLDESKRKEIGSGFVYKDDLLISRSGSIGIVAVVPKEADGFAFGSFMIKLCLNDDINKNFVTIWLNNKVLQNLIFREKIGAIQGNITIDTIKNFLIPLPPPRIQTQIADEVKNRMNKAKELKQEAKKLLEQAKEKIEEMILGE